MNYSLAATSMTGAQINSIRRKVHPEVIASKGYYRKCSRQLRYGYSRYRGLGIQNYRVKQRLRKIQITHKVLNHRKHVTLIRRIIVLYQLSAGTMKELIEYPTERINYVSSIWLQNLLHFIHKYKLKIVTKRYISLIFQRRNNKCIIDEIFRSNMTKIKLIQINTYMTFLTVIYLNDITEYNEKKSILSYSLEIAQISYLKIQMTQSIEYVT